ncbi:hypothetical protein [Rhizobium sp. M1]|uniref:hypothetical protein n=1 Tax=Rhizobium sp. M1 TaxID=2035453 RepID=UPI000BE935C6|nr:hypothetical protein [Rhizobium sp. M1]PDT08797.1 hypothetical protein CO655_20460 [Rhizobium sp. M1]
MSDDPDIAASDGCGARRHISSEGLKTTPAAPSTICAGPMKTAAQKLLHAAHDDSRLTVAAVKTAIGTPKHRPVKSKGIFVAG